MGGGTIFGSYYQAEYHLLLPGLVHASIMKLNKHLPTISALACLTGLGWLLATDATPVGVSPSAGMVNGLPTVRHVVFISCDGLRGDTLASMINVRPANYVHFKRLRDQGAATFRARTDYGFTETIPNHSSMVTGRPVYEPGTATQAGILGHGQVNNTGTSVTAATSVIHKLGGTGSYSYKSSVFDVVHESGRRTALFFSKDRINFLARSWDAINGLDTTGLPGVINGSKAKIDRVSPGTGFPVNANAVSDTFVSDATTNGLAAFTMLHFIDPDTSVHATAVTTTTPPAALSSYENAVLNCDTALGKIFAWLDARPVEKACTAIVLTADHGGVGGASSHIDAARVENYTIPLFLWGPGFVGGSDAYRYFSNRSDPALIRSSDLLASLPNPPIRNGDAANISTALLGLSAVQGSYYKPVLMNPDNTQLLRVTPAAEGVISMTWPQSATSFDLETANDLSSSAWTKVTTGISADGENNTATAPANGSRGFYRLRKK